MSEVAPDAGHYSLDYYGQTVLHPVGFGALLVLGLATLVAPRRYAVVPMLVMACFIAPAQRVAVFTLNFDLLRIMVLIASARVLLWSEWKAFRLHRTDGVLIAWAFVAAACYILLHGTAEAVKYKLGTTYDALGMYFVFRCLVRSWDDIHAIVYAVTWISFPIAAAFMVEHLTARNLFGFLGGVPEFTDIRDGRLRCQGAFAHPILAGTFWASLVPLIAAQWWRKEVPRYLIIGGVLSGLLIIAACASSGPVAAVVFAAMASSLFAVRHHMRWIRWGLLAMLLMLHMVMHAPVWHLIARVDLVGGSTGYHRFLLIDRAIAHLGEWWFMGTASTAHWGTTIGYQPLTDITNHYILEGIRGGLLALVLFVLLLASTFSSIGRLCRVSNETRARAVLAWALGISLFVHAISFLSVSYFGQITMLWYLTLAMICGAEASQRTRRVVQIKTDAAPAPDVCVVSASAS